MEAGRSVVYKNVIYFAPFDETHIHQYNHCSTPQWSILDEPMKWLNPGLAIIDGQVVTIGGKWEGTCTKEVWIWRENRVWESLREMHHERSDPGVITCNKYITVISGKGTLHVEDNWISFVEIYDTNNGIWNEVCPLPSPYTGIEVTLCKGTIYVFPDQFKQGVSCSLKDLKSSTTNSPWKPFKNCPLRYSSPVTVKDHVICIGGAEVKSDGLSDIYSYKETSDSWHKIGDLQHGRMYSMVEVCNKKLFVVGGVCKLTEERPCLSKMEIYTVK